MRSIISAVLYPLGRGSSGEQYNMCTDNNKLIITDGILVNTFIYKKNIKGVIVKKRVVGSYT